MITTPAAAVETCRFIEAKVDREACYHRQEAELAARRKAEPQARSSESSTFDALRQMRRDDEEVYRSLRSICRGC